MDLNGVHQYRLDWITSFVAVARYGSFSAAAKALYRSQPRISTHIAALEDLLGRRLVDRSVQPATLTPEGHGLLPHAEEIVRQLGLLRERAAGTAYGTVRIGCYPSAAAYLYPLMTKALRVSHPGVRLVLHEGPSVALGDRLLGGEVDMAVRPLHPMINSDRVANHTLWREPLVAVFRSDHHLAGAGSVLLAQTAALPVVTIGESEDRHSHEYETSLAFAAAGLRPVVSERTNQPQTLVSLVRHGFGVGVTNALAMKTAQTDGVALVPLADTGCERVVAAWWRSGEELSPAVAAVHDCLSALPAPRWPWGEHREEDTGE